SDGAGAPSCILKWRTQRRRRSRGFKFEPGRSFEWERGSEREVSESLPCCLKRRTAGAGHQSRIQVWAESGIGGRGTEGAGASCCAGPARERSVNRGFKFGPSRGLGGERGS